MQTGGAPGNPPAHGASLGCVVGFLAVRLPESANLRAYAFYLLRLTGTDTATWPYRRRRAMLESLFATRRLSAPWALCPSINACSAGTAGSSADGLIVLRRVGQPGRWTSR
jgi:hypothetical protein